MNPLHSQHLTYWKLFSPSKSMFVVVAKVHLSPARLVFSPPCLLAFSSPFLLSTSLCRHLFHLHQRHPSQKQPGLLIFPPWRYCCHLHQHLHSPNHWVHMYSLLSGTIDNTSRPGLIHLHYQPLLSTALRILRCPHQCTWSCTLFSRTMDVNFSPLSVTVNEILCRHTTAYNAILATSHTTSESIFDSTRATTRLAIDATTQRQPNDVVVQHITIIPRSTAIEWVRRKQISLTVTYI